MNEPCEKDIRGREGIPMSGFRGRRLFAKRSAKAILSVRENWLLLFFAGLICLVGTMLPMLLFRMLYVCEGMLGDAFDGFLKSSLAEILEWICIALVGIPLFSGYLYIVVGLARGQGRQVSDVFYAFSSFRAYLRGFLAILLPALCIGLAVSISVLFANAGAAVASVVKANYRSLIFNAADFLSAFFGLFFVLLCGYVMPFGFFLLEKPKRSVWRALSMSCLAARGRLAEISCFFISLIGWILLSAATIGIVFVLFAAPFMLLSTAVFFGSLSEDVNFDSNSGKDTDNE